jgi:hypothetical protein
MKVRKVKSDAPTKGELMQVILKAGLVADLDEADAIIDQMIDEGSLTVIDFETEGGVQ